MSNKNRIKFSVAGSHSLLSLVRDFFIQQGMALVPWDDSPDFCLIGNEVNIGDHLPVAQIEWQLMQVKNKPVLLLSSDSIYDAALDMLGSVKVSEKTPLVIHSGNRATTGVSLFPLLSEYMMLQGAHKVAVVRPFNVYGPSINTGVVHTFINQIKRKSVVSIDRSGYQSRSFIHEEDFLNAIQYVLVELLENTKDTELLYNIGTEEEITIQQLAEMINRSINDADCELQANYSHGSLYTGPWYKVPDISKLKELGWSQKMRLRWGIRDLVKE